jgi:bacterioferritin-associated ferredoxin
MIVCSCNVLSEDKVRTAARVRQVHTVADVYRELGGCTGQCHRCARSLKAIIDEVKAGGCQECGVVCRQRLAEPAVEAGSEAPRWPLLAAE